MIRVMAWPAFKNRAIQPYNALLYSALSKKRVQVDEFSFGKSLFGSHDILHFHWPEYSVAGAHILEALVRAAAFFLVIEFSKVRGKRIVWTAHNLKGHHTQYPALEAIMWKWLTRRIDGWISLSTMGNQLLLERHPALAHRPNFTIPLGHYRGEYPDTITRQEARSDLNLPTDSFVIAFVGTILPYKNVAQLISAFRPLPEQALRLVIAGKPATTELAADIVKATNDDSRVQLFLEFVPNEQLQVFFRSADLVVLPYRDILNSASALVALSYSCPVLVPDRGAMTDLRDTVGSQWVATYQGELDSAKLLNAISWVKQVSRSSVCDLDGRSWDRIASMTLAAYEKCLYGRMVTSLESAV